MPASLRKADETKTLFFPALVKMLMEVEEDEATWSTTDDGDENLATDPVSVAMSSLRRFAEDIGEKTILAAAQPVIADAIKQDNWKHRQTGYTVMGLIS